MTKVILQTNYDETTCTGFSIRQMTGEMIYQVGAPLTNRTSMGYPSPVTVMLAWFEEHKEYTVGKTQDSIRVVNSVNKEVTVRIEKEVLI